MAKKEEKTAAVTNRKPTNGKGSRKRKGVEAAPVADSIVEEGPKGRPLVDTLGESMPGESIQAFPHFPPPDDDEPGGTGVTWTRPDDEVEEPPGAEEPVQADDADEPMDEEPAGDPDGVGGMMPGICQRFVKVQLSDVETVRISRQAASVYRQIENTKAEKSAVVSDYSGKIKNLELRHAELVRQIETGFYMKNVDCRCEMDFSAGEKRFLDIDTGEVVAIEILTAADRQMSVPGME